VRRVAVGACLTAGLLLAGCAEPTAEERRDEYCQQVREDSEELTRMADEGKAGAFLSALPTLESLAEQAPSDIGNHWALLLDALHGLEDALEETGVEAEQVDGKLPADVSAADRRKVSAAASVLVDPEVVAATREIEQHALDICKTPLL
jgi:hypothetical protein